jgi:two-component system, chemotaxis family, protein-glutamate methylesterase/glutaminase
LNKSKVNHPQNKNIANILDSNMKSSQSSNTSTNPVRKIKVLVVDDSPLIRDILSTMINSSEELELVACAKDAYEAKECVTKHKPDVITLDIEMPKVSGLVFLEKLMKAQPTPVLMISSLTTHGANASIKALSLGAVDYFPKPSTSIASTMDQYQATIIKKIILTAKARLIVPKIQQQKVHQRLTGPSLKRVIAIGASVGGVEAIYGIITAMPDMFPPVIITQHLPVGYTRSFARRLNGNSRLTVIEAEGGEYLQPGHVYVAPGDRHLKVLRKGNELMTMLDDGDKVCGHKPSVDVMFYSVAEIAGKQSIGIILTGMGRDGAEGLKAIRDAGGKTYGQNEQTSVVYGMPGQAMKMNAVDEEIALSDINASLVDYLLRLKP